MDVLKELLHKGYFPVQLPPGFTSESFSRNYSLFSTDWESKSNKIPSCRIEKFSVARSSFYRRITSIVNPVAYYFLSKSISDYWVDIENHYSKSPISLSRPIIDPSLRAIKIHKFNELYESKIKMSAGYKYALFTDITSFFPTIYTHTIPWAIHGKSIAKRNKQKIATYFGNIIDAKSMGLQDWQTIGLPIGPDTSHIIAEIIGVAIDIEIYNSIGSWPCGFRYVDDFCFFIDTIEDAEKLLKFISRAVSNYELQLNPSKTKIIEVKELISESWKYTIKKLKISSKIKIQKNDIHNYFETIISLEQKHNDESLIKYALKQITSSIIKKTNWPIFEAYLLKCGYSYPNTIQVIANILSTYNKYSYPLNKNAISRFCNNLIIANAECDYHSEVAWLLWICKELELEIKHDTINEIEGMTSSICILIILDLYHSNKINKCFSKMFLKQFANADSLYNTNWLLAYEAGRRNWLNNTNYNYISKDNFFNSLLINNINFYDENLFLTPIFKLKSEVENDFYTIDHFDTDEAIDDYFEFDEMSEEYFDSLEDDDEDENDDVDENDDDSNSNKDDEDFY